MVHSYCYLVDSNTSVPYLTTAVNFINILTSSFFIWKYHTCFAKFPRIRKYRIYSRLNLNMKKNILAFAKMENPEKNPFALPYCLLFLACIICEKNWWIFTHRLNFINVLRTNFSYERTFWQLLRCTYN